MILLFPLKNLKLTIKDVEIFSQDLLIIIKLIRNK